MKKMISGLVPVFAALSLQAVPSVSNVSIAQDANTRRLTVSYSLNEEAIVTFETNLGGEAFYGTEWGGDVNRKLAAGSHSATWLPRPGLPVSAATLKVKVVAWALDTPPDYMSVDFAACQMGAKYGQRYYASTNDLPHPVVSDYYRRDAMLFRRIPARGVTFGMGTPGAVSGTETYHEVTLTNDYYLGVFPVTQSQWVNAIKKSYDTNMNAAPMPSQSVPNDRDDSYLRPCNNVSYKQLCLYINGLDVNHLYVDGQGVCSTTWLYYLQMSTGLKNVTIPTDAQWEYACRAGTDGERYDTVSSLDDLAWYSGNVTEPQPVGLKKPNPWGLYDMLGNVWEQCMDYWQSDLGTAAVTQPFIFGSHAKRVVRGGCYSSPANDCRSARRTTKVDDAYTWIDSNILTPEVGFRVMVGIH